MTRAGFGELLRKEIYDRRWNMAILGRESGVSQVSIARYLRGGAFPGFSEFLKICKALKKTPNEFLGITDWTDCA